MTVYMSVTTAAAAACIFGKLQLLSSVVGCIRLPLSSGKLVIVYMLMQFGTSNLSGWEQDWIYEE